MVVKCPKCNTQFNVPERLYGKSGKCAKCGVSIRIPFPAKPSAKPPALQAVLIAGILLLVAGLGIVGYMLVRTLGGGQPYGGGGSSQEDFKKEKAIIYSAPFDPDKIMKLDNGAEIVSNQVVVILKQGTSQDSIGEILKKYNLEIVGRNSEIDAFQLKINGNTSPMDLKSKLEGESAIASVDVNDVVKSSKLVPVEMTWIGSRSWMYTISHLPDAWDITKGSPNVTIAIVDTGVFEHDDLKGRLISGYNFIENNKNSLISSEGNNHGTIAAGVAAAQGNNSIGSVGVCWECKIMAIRAVHDFGKGAGWDIAVGISSAARQGAKIINVSYGSVAAITPRYYELAISKAKKEYDSLVIVAAGNQDSNAKLFTPANNKQAITVGMTDSNDKRYHGGFLKGSNYGNAIDISAPGVDLDCISNSGKTATLLGECTGTSFSAPYIAGVAGLIWSVNPELSSDEVRNILLTTADPIPTDEPMGSACLNDELRSKGFNGCRVNALKAVQKAKGIDQGAEQAPVQKQEPDFKSFAKSLCQSKNSGSVKIFKRFWDELYGAGDDYYWDKGWLKNCGRYEAYESDCSGAIKYMYSDSKCGANNHVCTTMAKESGINKCGIIKIPINPDDNVSCINIFGLVNNDWNLLGQNFDCTLEPQQAPSPPVQKRNSDIDILKKIGKEICNAAITGDFQYIMKQSHQEEIDVMLKLTGMSVNELIELPMDRRVTSCSILETMLLSRTTMNQLISSQYDKAIASLEPNKKQIGRELFSKLSAGEQYAEMDAIMGYGDNSQKPHYVIFIKVHGKWRISPFLSALKQDPF